MGILKTPRSLWIVAGLAAFLYVTAPVVDAVFLYTQLGRGVYPTNADSIGIPMYVYSMALLVLSPVYVLFTYAALRRYVGGRSFLEFDTGQWLRSTVWALVYGGLSAYSLWEAGRFGLMRMPVSVIASVLWAYLFLCVRASLASRTPEPGRG